MPANAGIQELHAEASSDASWIPGLAVLARNDNDVVTTTHAAYQALATRTCADGEVSGI